MWVASYHSGNGWYLEQTYNYYTISLFIVYMMIWNRSFGDQYYPEIAETIERSARELMKTYPEFFGRDGYVNMWARSICYRTWISGGFPEAIFGVSPDRSTDTMAAPAMLGGVVEANAPQVT